MQAALDHLQTQGVTLNDEDIARLSPLCPGISICSPYLAEQVTKDNLRPIKEAPEGEMLPSELKGVPLNLVTLTIFRDISGEITTIKQGDNHDRSNCWVRPR